MALRSESTFQDKGKPNKAPRTICTQFTIQKSLILHNFAEQNIQKVGLEQFEKSLNHS